MDNYKLAFDANDDPYIDLDPIDCIDLMFENTGSDGNLCIRAWPYDDGDETSESHYVLKMDWDENRRDLLVAEYIRLIRHLENIASVYDKLGSNKDDNRKLLSPDDLAAWDIYIRTLKNPDEAGLRLENKLAAYDLIIRAQRVCKLISLKAPKVIIDNEKRLLAQALVVNSYAVSMERF